MKKEMTCIVCPKGCNLIIEKKNDGSFAVQGNECKRGETYAIQEMTDPRRNISSTVRVRNGEHAMLPVKTDREIPKAMIFEVMAEINRTEVEAPIELHRVILEDVAGTGTNIIACRSIAVKK